MLLDDAADVAAECADLDEAEVWASSAQVLFGPVCIAGSTVLPASSALAAAEACPDRGAAAMVAASISAYGPPRDRRRATRLLARLAENGEPLPRWINALGVWVPIIRSWALTRGFALHPGTRNRYEIRDTRTQHRPPSRQVNDHGRVSGTHVCPEGK